MTYPARKEQIYADGRLSFTSERYGQVDTALNRKLKQDDAYPAWGGRTMDSLCNMYSRVSRPFQRGQFYQSAQIEGNWGRRNI